MTTRRDRGLDVSFTSRINNLNIVDDDEEELVPEEDPDEQAPYPYDPPQEAPVEEHKRIPPSLPVCLHLKCKAKIHIKVAHGDIAESGVDCIVSSAPEGMSASSGVAGVLVRAGGEHLEMDIKNYIQQHGNLKTGEVGVTDGGNIQCRRIIHACGPSGSDCQAALAQTFDKCLEKAMDCESIAIPGVSGGARGVPNTVVAGALCQSITEFCKAAETTPCSLKHILVVDVNESIIQAVVDAFEDEITKGTFELTDFDEEVSASRRGGGFDYGKMKTTTNTVEHLPGYDGCGTITIVYEIPSGVQSDKHPNPGKRYTGVTRTAYLPNNAQGRKLLGLMEEAFNQNLTFDIGKSTATGSSDVIVWSGKVSHRTNQTKGPAQYGYPDAGYLDKVEAELAALGIK